MGYFIGTLVTLLVVYFGYRIGEDKEGQGVKE